jgi:ABC-type antimicrobial peptide transport system permease subunit
VGVTPWQLMLLIYAETAIQVVMASVMAVVFGWSLSSYLEENGIDLSSFAEGASFAGVAIDPMWKAYLTPEAIMVPVVFLFIIAFIAVLYPAVKAAVIRPVSAIHHR